MLSSPRLHAAAAVLASFVLFALAHAAQAATRPAIRFTATPAAVTSAPSGGFTIVRSAPGRVRSQMCRIDAGAWKPCGRTLAVRRLADGAHTVRARLVMQSGASTTAVYSWRVDSVAPAAPAVTGGGAGWSADTSRTVAHGAAADPSPRSGVASYRSRISTDGGATWMPGPDGSVDVAAEGETLVQYAAVDRAGNVSPWSASAVVRLDRTAPTAPAASANAAWTNAAAVTVIDGRDATDALSGIDPTGYEVQVSADGGTTWSRPALDADGTLLVADEGVRLVRFRAHDEAGNAGEWSPVPALVRIDRTAPVTPVISGAPDGWSSAALVHLTIAGDDALEHQESLDGGTTWSQPVAGAGIDVTGEGTTLVRARACDAAGNCSDWSATAAVALDRTPPTAPPGVAGGDGGNPSCFESSISEVTFTAAPATDAGSGIDHYIWRLSRFSDTPLPLTGASQSVRLTYPTISLSVRIRFAAVDEAGNTGPWSDGTLSGANVCLAPPGV